MSTQISLKNLSYFQQLYFFIHYRNSFQSIHDYSDMANSGNFHSKKSQSTKIFCAWCQNWKTGDIVLTFTKGANWKIHKHSKGDKPCKGSDKIVMKKKES